MGYFFECASGCMTYRQWLDSNRRARDPASLTDYIRQGPTDEGWNSEFKRATTDLGYGVREAVASLANARGGEVFVGVDDKGAVVGTAVVEQHMNDTLRQRGLAPADWYASDLLQVVLNTAAVPFGDGKKWAYVLEVRDRERPTFVLDERGVRVFPVRSSSDTVKLDSLGAIEWYRRTGRGDVLRECYRELVTFMPQVSAYRRLPDGLPDPLPFLNRVQTDPALRGLLKAGDLEVLFGKGIQGGRISGVTDPYYRVVHRVAALLGDQPNLTPYVRIVDLPGMAGEFADVDREIQLSLDSFSRHLTAQGYPVEAHLAP